MAKEKPPLVNLAERVDAIVEYLMESHGLDRAEGWSGSSKISDLDLRRCDLHRFITATVIEMGLDQASKNWQNILQSERTKNTQQFDREFLEKTTLNKVNREKFMQDLHSLCEQLVTQIENLDQTASYKINGNGRDYRNRVRPRTHGESGKEGEQSWL